MSIYTPISFTALEQPTQAKWNLLGANDASFNVGTGFSKDLATGWVMDNDTWTYASATTITITSGGTAKYEKGMRIRLKQGGAYKYFYIINIASTLMTISGGTDYTLVNSVITDNYFSSIDPLDFPAYLNMANNQKFRCDGQALRIVGWNYLGVTNAVNAATSSVTYGLTFGEIALVNINYLGNGAAATTLGSYNITQGYFPTADQNSTTGFRAALASGNATNFPGTANHFYSWMAQGAL